MKFDYSFKSLLMIFLSRLIPSLVFWYFALLWGEVFWIITILMWAEAVLETLYWWKRGFVTIEKDRIIKHFLFFNNRLSLTDIKEVFVYGDEWTFASGEFSKPEIKILRNRINPGQIELLDEKLNELWGKIREQQKTAQSQS